MGVDEFGNANVLSLFRRADPLEPELLSYPYDTVKDRQELDQLRDETYAEYWLSEYGTEPDQFGFESIFPVMQRSLKKYAFQGTVIEFGCGPGSCVKEFLDWSPANYIGIDVNKRFLEEAKEKHKDKPNAHFYRKFQF